MIYMESVSNGQGNMTLTVTFELGTDPDIATINVNNRVQMATSSIPEEVRKYGITVQKSSPNLLLIASLLSPDGRYDTIYMSNYALLNILDDPQKDPRGQRCYYFYTAQDYAMRIWIKPDKLHAGSDSRRHSRGCQRPEQPVCAGKVRDQPTDEDIEKTYIITTKDASRHLKSLKR